MHNIKIITYDRVASENVLELLLNLLWSVFVNNKIKSHFSYLFIVNATISPIMFIDLSQT